MSFCNKLKFTNSFIFATWWCKPIIFQTYVIRSNRIHSLKEQMYTTSGCKDTRIKKLSLLQELIFFGLLFLFGYAGTNNTKELIFCQKLKCSNPNIFATRWSKSLIFQTYIIWSNITYNMTYLRSTTSGFRDTMYEENQNSFVIFPCLYFIFDKRTEPLSPLSPYSYAHTESCTYRTNL